MADFFDNSSIMLKKILNEPFGRYSGLVNILKVVLLSKMNYKKAFFVVSTEQKALQFQSDIENLFGIKAQLFTAQEISPYEMLDRNKIQYSDQIKTIEAEPKLVIAPVKALLERFPTKDFLNENKITIKKDGEVEPKALSNKLVKLGYKRVTMVSDAGEFSIRGDIIDIYPICYPPVRIELWGDEVVDIRFFDRKTQRSYEKIDSFDIYPLYKFILNEEEVVQEGIEFFENKYNSNLKPIFDVISKDYTVIFDETVEIESKFLFFEENLLKNYQNNLKNGLIEPLEKLNHITLKEFKQSCANNSKLYFDNFLTDDEVDYEFNCEIIPSFCSKIEDVIVYIEEKIKKGFKIIVATNFQSRLEEILKSFEILTPDVKIVENLSLGGAVLNDFKVVILTDKELFNKKSKEITAVRKNRNKENQEYIDSINDIQEGEYVVHSVHGIGRYLGLTKQEIDGELKDYLSIEYANKDKLYMPAEQINLLCRYRGALTAKLSKMGGGDWNTIKSRAKKAVEDVAKDLLRLYAGRKMSEGIAFDEDTVWQYEMEEAFPYTETPDQMSAILDTKSDMELSKPMDRLICGDVGFGKTEVAIRAVFKAVMSEKQVAVVAPTTLLAYQHYKTFKERFAPFPVKVELLSGYKSSKEQKETVRKLALGECDVVIGTHRLLQDDILFKNLGLLVIDEEHKFGVRHKEKLKELKKNIDILTMSATPIPRTLYMSLSGIKDISVINTPPVNRLPIKTFVGEYKDTTVKNAIINELDREGQVFILYNRVETINQFADSIKKLVPNANVCVGHGQMDKKVLEEIMLDFAQKKFDVFVCTTIIESGLDIPNANTMIIMDADKFGLAQLYQIRGRVGRSERQAYCYCLYKNSMSLTKEAFNRLQAIKDFTNLGSGYQIALRDIEIRGVGNILGTRQHGQMINVGFDTYCQLLEDTINELQGEKVEPVIPAIIDINISAFIPDEWVMGEGADIQAAKEQKMIEYKKLADVKNSSELDLIMYEWKDRFSKLPKEVENLIKLVRLRLSATDAKIKLVRQSSDVTRVYMPYTKPEWFMIYQRLPKNITKYLTYTMAPKSCQDGNSILLIKSSLMDFEELFNILEDLFYHINTIVKNLTES